MKTLPRGIRNNNPFNLDFNPANKWQGLATVQSDPRFCVFTDAPYGIRAGMRNLIAAQDQHNRRTVKEIISAYAPASENDTAAYINAVCEYMGVSVMAQLDMHSYSDLRSLSEAIIGHENGGVWSSWYTDAQMVKACVMAGVQPPKKPLIISRQMIGSAIAATATIGAPVVQTVQEQLQPLTDYSIYIKYAFLAAALLGIVFTAWAKIDERRKGIS